MKSITGYVIRIKIPELDVKWMDHSTPVGK